MLLIGTAPLGRAGYRLYEATDVALGVGVGIAQSDGSGGPLGGGSFFEIVAGAGKTGPDRALVFVGQRGAGGRSSVQLVGITPCIARSVRKS